MCKHIGIYPGSFDPITLGHMDLIQRSLKVVGTLIIGIGTNPSKAPLFSVEDRIDMIQTALKTLGLDNTPKVEIKTFQGLLVDFGRENGAQTIIRGIRAVSDFEYEFQMAAMNRKINPDLETVFLMASDHTQFIASRFVKEIAELKGDISRFVIPEVQKKIQDKF